MVLAGLKAGIAKLGCGGSVVPAGLSALGVKALVRRDRDTRAGEVFQRFHGVGRAMDAAAPLSGCRERR